MAARSRLEIEPHTHVDPSRTGSSAAAKSAANCAVGYAEERRGQHTVVGSKVYMIKDVVCVDAECQIVFMPGIAAHHHHRAAATPSAHYHRSAAESSAAAAAVLISAASILIRAPISALIVLGISLAVLLIAGISLTILLICVRRRGASIVIWSWTKSEGLRYAQINADKSRPLAEVPGNNLF